MIEVEGVYYYTFAFICYRVAALFFIFLGLAAIANTFPQINTSKKWDYGMLFRGIVFVGGMIFLLSQPVG